MKFNEDKINVEIEREEAQELVAKAFSQDKDIDPKELDSLSDETLASTINMLSQNKEEGFSFKERITNIKDSLGEYDVLVEKVMEELGLKLSEAEEILNYYGF